MVGICAKCKDEKVIYPNKKTGQLMCQRCQKQYTRKPLVCKVCREERKDVYRSRRTRELTCSKCYKQKLQPRVPCSVCSQKRIVANHDPQGRPVCDVCRRSGKNTRICSLCHEKRIVGRWTEDGQPICNLCLKLFINLKPCSRCNLTKSVAKKLRNGKYLCRACLEQRSKGRCPRCGHKRALVSRIEGQLCCRPCKWEYDTATCKRCGRERPIVAAGFCAGCYHFVRGRNAAKLVASITIGTPVYRYTTKERGVVRGVRFPANFRSKEKKLRATEFQIVVLNRRSEHDVFWPALECRLISHQRRKEDS